MDEENLANEQLETARQMVEAFEGLVMSEGVPMMDAHVLATSAGTVLHKGMPVGHDNDLIMLGMVQSGLLNCRPAHEEDEDGAQWYVVRENEYQWLTGVVVSRRQAERLYASLGEVLSRED